MDQYEDSLTKYYKTLEMVSGCGNRGQSYINKAYKELVEMYEKLTEQEKTNNKLPVKARLTDDGTGGIATGMSLLGK